MQIDVLLDRLRDRGGCARRSDLVCTSGDAHALRAAVGSGEIRQVARGFYAVPGASPSLVAARRAGGVVSCVSVLEALDLPLLSVPPGPHLALPAHRGAPRPGLLARGVVLHWDAAVGPEQVAARRPAADLPVALLHTMSCLPAQEVVAAMDAALNRGLTELPDLLACRPRAERVRFDRLLRRVDGRSQSICETFARLALAQAGLHVELQVPVAGVGLVDLLVEGMVVVELDGMAYHSGREQFREDRRRDRALELLGVPVLRFTYEDAVRGTGRLVHEVTTLVRTVQRSRVRPVIPRGAAASTPRVRSR
ncbi:type IV toxin-antitoxin system AbiEi family antitoxin domain-containing protein [Cellulomonas hominis]